MNKKENFEQNTNSIFKEFLTSNHHAFILESENREEIFEYFEQKIKQENNTENLFINLKVFDIEKAREIVEYNKINFDKQHFIVVSFYSINREAQNVLLKFLEETSKNIKTIFIIHSGAKILDTIYSRMYKLNSFFGPEKDKNSLEELAKTFLKTNKLSRMRIKEITDLLSKRDEYALEYDDKDRADREIVEIFILAIHKNLFDKYKINKDKELEICLSELQEYLKYIKNNSSSGKTILEYLAFKLPEIS